MDDQLKVGVIGATIRVDVVETLVSPTDMRIYYKKPSGETDYFTASADGTTHIKYKTTSITDIDESGLWIFEAYIIMTGFTGFGKRDSTCIEANIV